MRTAGLAMLAAGAVLTFAVSAHVPGINFRLAGLIIIVAGLIGLIAPSGAGAWARRHVLTRRETGHADGDGPAASEPDEVEYPAYLLQDPAVLAAEVLNGVRARATGTGPTTAGLRAVRRTGPGDGDWR